MSNMRYIVITICALIFCSSGAFAEDQKHVVADLGSDFLKLSRDYYYATYWSVLALSNMKSADGEELVVWVDGANTPEDARRIVDDYCRNTCFLFAIYHRNQCAAISRGIQSGKKRFIYNFSVQDTLQNALSESNIACRTGGATECIVVARRCW